MSRQAARKKKSTKASVANSKPAMLWLVLGVLGGLVLAGLIYLKQNHQALASLTHHQKHHAHLTKLKHEPVTPVAQNDNAKPQFDFYNILSGQKESTHHAEAHAKSVGKPATAKLELPAPQATEKSKTELSPASSAATVPTVAEKSEEPVKIKTGYVLQLASVKSYDEADKLKAQLTMLGYDVTVQKANRDHQVTYRVILGPYSTVAIAQSQQSKLRKSNISSIIIKTG